MVFSVSQALAIAVGGLIAVMAVRAYRSFRSIPRIKTLAAGTSPPDGMVVIPARNESAFIETAVRSFPPDSVIVVDDGSSDQTRSLAENAGAGVIAAPTLLRGANGKSNACAAGASVLTSRWILFADADTSYDAGFLESAIATAESNNLDFLSLYLRPEFESASEKIYGPLAAALYFFSIQPAKDPFSGFNGQCVLVRRQAYEFIGGHGTIVKEHCDDVRIAGLALRHRMRIAVMRADHMGRVRIRVDGIRRQSHRFGIISTWAGVRVLFGSCIFALWLAATIYLLVDARYWEAGALYLWLCISFASWFHGPMRSWTAPVSVAALLPLLFDTALGWLTGRPGEWKGRVI